jgi:GNAT superfamily N-acetyltransferase
MITYRWIEGSAATEEEWDRLEAILASNSWMALSREASMVLVAEYADSIVGFCVLQVIPHLEPLYVAPEFRGSDIAVRLADQAVEYMHKINARGWVSVAQHPVAARLCEREGMKQIQHPVYVYARGINGRSD